MKKKTFLTVILLLFTNVVAFADYEDYSSPSSNNLRGWIIYGLIIAVIFSILQLILFFKIWGMTNDVRKLKEKFVFNEIQAPTDVIAKAMFLHLKDKDEEAYVFLNDILYDCFLKYIKSLGNIGDYAQNKDNGCYCDSLGYNLNEWFEKKKEDKIKEMEVLYHKIGKEIPLYLKELTFASFVEFNQEKQVSDEETH